MFGLKPEFYFYFYPPPKGRGNAECSNAERVVEKNYNDWELMINNMNKTSAIAIFDIGKTNKKLLLFDERYKLVFEQSTQLQETTDEDGFACEDVMHLTQWVQEAFNKIVNDEKFIIKAVNVAAYGASLVYLNAEEKVMPPLYNYLKPFPAQLLNKFYQDYGEESLIGKQTASPSLGNLNAGLQLYRLKYEKPLLFAKIKWALHLPQYISYILSANLHSDITSIGCHTYLWDFQQQQYHSWVNQEGFFNKLPAIKSCSAIAGYTTANIPVGVGLHDSSSALVPYLSSFLEPFILLSTGTWCISLNPFNHTRLSDYELSNDCLCYLSHQGKPVKASRLFAGNEHELQIKQLAAYFDKPINYFTSVYCDAELLNQLKPVPQKPIENEHTAMLGRSFFEQRNLGDFSSYEAAYHQLIADIIEQQINSTNLVLQNTFVKRIFVDGGFSSNPIYMQLLAKVFPDMEVFAAALPQAAALGAALVMHQHWNTNPLPLNLMELKLYTHPQKIKH